MALFKKTNKEELKLNYIDDVLQEIYSANTSVDLNILLERAEDILKAFNSFMPLAHEHEKSFETISKYRFIYHNSLIENNTISREEVNMVLQQNQVVPGKSFREHIEIANTREAINFTIQIAQAQQKLSKELFLHLHYLTLKMINTKDSGIYRYKESSFVGSDYIPTTPSKIEQEVNEMFNRYYRDRDNKINPIILSTNLHKDLLLIKPFMDNNGILARLLVNFVMIKAGYPIINISGSRESQLEYFDVLEEMRKDIIPLYKFMTSCTIKTISVYIKKLIILSSSEKGDYFYNKVKRTLGDEVVDKLKALRD